MAWIGSALASILRRAHLPLCCFAVHRPVLLRVSRFELIVSGLVGSGQAGRYNLATSSANPGLPNASAALSSYWLKLAPWRTCRRKGQIALCLRRTLNPQAHFVDLHIAAT